MRITLGLLGALTLVACSNAALTTGSPGAGGSHDAAIQETRVDAGGKQDALVRVDTLAEAAAVQMAEPLIIDAHADVGGDAAIEAHGDARVDQLSDPSGADAAADRQADGATTLPARRASLQRAARVNKGSGCRAAVRSPGIAARASWSPAARSIARTTA